MAFARFASGRVCLVLERVIYAARLMLRVLKSQLVELDYKTGYLELFTRRG